MKSKSILVLLGTLLLIGCQENDYHDCARQSMKIVREFGLSKDLSEKYKEKLVQRAIKWRKDCKDIRA